MQGCKSEKAYADECDLGHQFNPEDLIKPVSTLSGEVPEMRPVRNWYFDLPNFRAQLQEHAARLEADEEVRPVVVKGAKEFLVPPVMYIKNELEEDYRAIADKLPAHSFHEAEKGKQSFEIEFESIEDRDKARDVLFEAGVRFRTGKALVPFRISGNVEWGVKVPEMDGVDGLTVWCWPESLWAPISFSAAALESRGESLAPCATGGARPMRASISSSARTTCISTAWHSLRCGWASRTATPCRPSPPRASCSRRV